MASGIGVSSQFLQDYQSFSQKKQVDNKDGKDGGPFKLSYIIAAIGNGNKEIITEELGYVPQFKNTDAKAEAENFDKVVFPEFVKKLTARDGPRFAVIDVHIIHAKDGRIESKIVAIRWSPDKSDSKAKMIYSSSEGAFKAKMSASKIFQANDASDLTQTEINKFAFASAAK
jgi:hypothetical protein